mgnify:CR=1 FL=1
MAKKTKKIMLTDPIDVDKFGKGDNIIPKDYKSMKAKKYTKKNTKKELTWIEKIKNFSQRLIVLWTKKLKFKV